MMKNRSKILSMLSIFLVITGMTLISAADSDYFAFSEGDMLIWKVNTTISNSTDTESSLSYRGLNITEILDTTEYVNVTFTSLESNNSIVETDPSAAEWVGIEMLEGETNVTEMFNKSYTESQYFPFFNTLNVNMTEFDGSHPDELYFAYFNEIAYHLAPEFMVYYIIMAFMTMFAEDYEMSNSTYINDHSATNLDAGFNLETNVNTSEHWSNMSIAVNFTLEYGEETHILQTGNISTYIEITDWDDDLMNYVTEWSLIEHEYLFIHPEEYQETQSTTTTTTSTTTSTNTSTTTGGTETETEGSNFFSSIPGYNGFLFGISIFIGIFALLFGMKRMH